MFVAKWAGKVENFKSFWIFHTCDNDVGSFSQTLNIFLVVLFTRTSYVQLSSNNERIFTLIRSQSLKGNQYIFELHLKSTNQQHLSLAGAVGAFLLYKVRPHLMKAALDIIDIVSWKRALTSKVTDNKQICAADSSGYRRNVCQGY